MTDREPVSGTSSGARPLPYWTRKAAESRLGIAWFVCFVLGAFWITGVERIDFQRFLMPIALMLGYLLVGIRTPNKNFTKFADSIYFLGFLWTLVALIATLVLGEGIEQKHVLTAFGYALVATGAGMFLRTLLLQFHETVVDTIDQAQADIDQQVQLLAAELGRATTAAKQLADSAAEAQVSALQPFIEKSEQAASVLEESSGRVATALENATAEMSAQLRKSVEALGLAAVEISTEASAISEPLHEVGNKARASIELLQEAIGAAAARLAESAGEAARAIETAVDPERLKTQIDGSLDFVRAAAGDLASSCQSAARRVEESSDDFSGNVSNLAAGVETYRGALAGLAERTEQLAASATVDLAEKITSAERAVEQAKNAGSNLNSTIQEVLDFVRSRMNEPDS